MDIEFMYIANFFPLYITYPHWIHPQILPNIPVLNLVRWYGLMYIVAFSVSYIVLKRICKEGMLDTPDTKTTEDEIFSFMSTSIIFLLIGARVFSTLVYDTSGIYWKKPWLMFWPFGEKGEFTGLAGMSYHGGLIGGLVGAIFWCVQHKKPVLKWIDAIAIAIPAGYTFGRIGNFLNGELYGRVTSVPWGIIFPAAEKYSLSYQWVRDIAMKAGMNISSLGQMVNLPRHPSQLYEAFFEGVILFLFLWLLRKRRFFDGFFGTAYVAGYGFVRFIIEYFRQPDADIGFRRAVQQNANIALNTSILNISTGQVLCALMVICGLSVMLYCYLKKQMAHKKRNH